MWKFKNFPTKPTTEILREINCGNLSDSKIKHANLTVLKAVNFDLNSGTWKMSIMAGNLKKLLSPRKL